MGKSVDFEECRLEVENKPLSVCLSDDSDESDQRQLFELPRRKVVRPPTSSFKKKLGNSRRNCFSNTGLCCKVCFATIIPIFIATFIVATIICFAVLVVGVSGIKAELDGVKIRLSNAEDAEKDFNVKRDQLQRDFQEKLTQLTNHAQKVKAFESTIESLGKQLTSLNNSLTELRSHPLLNVESIKQDLDRLKNGMADTGSNILKLEGNYKGMEGTMMTLQSGYDELQVELFNITVRISDLEHKPPQERLTTPQTLVVTLTPDEDMPVKRKELDETVDKLREEQKEICRAETSNFMTMLGRLRNETSIMNLTHLHRIWSLENKESAEKTSNHEDEAESFHGGGEEEHNRSGVVLPSVTSPTTTTLATGVNRLTDARTPAKTPVTRTVPTASSTTGTTRSQNNRSSRKGVDESNFAGNSSDDASD